MSVSKDRETSDLFIRLEQFFIHLLEEAEEDVEALFLTRTRGGIFSSALTIFLIMCQRLQQRQTLMGSLEALSAGAGKMIIERNPLNRRARMEGISLNTGGLSRARTRIDLGYIRRIAEVISRALIAKSPASGKWHGRDVYLMDGTMIRLARSEATQKKYPSSSNQHRTCNTSEMICTCVHSLLTGVALAPAYGAYRGKEAIGEVTLGKNMIRQLPAGGLLVADRAFATFGIAYCAQENGQQVLVRLSESRAQCLLGHKPGKSDVDKEVVWHPTAHYLKKYSEIPSCAEVKGRFIKHTVRRKGFRPLPLMFFTTSDESSASLCALYQKREIIENDIRSLKYTLGLEMIRAKTPDMIEKELLLGVLAYNLLRSIIASSAGELGVLPRQISFSRAAALITVFSDQVLQASSDSEIEELRQRFLTGLRQSKLPVRSKQRIEPRKIVRKRRLFPLMKSSREEDRKAAVRTLEKHGHRGYFTTVSRKH